MSASKPGDFRRIVAPLAVAQTLSWAAMYYSFPALLLTLERDLGWSKTQLTGAYTFSLILSALLAPTVGRLIDRGHGRATLTGCALLGAGALCCLSQVREVWQFYTVYAVLGIAMAGALYEACFALLTRCMGGQARRAITRVTLVAGFAGTVSFPGTYALLSMFDWRGAVLAWAAVVVAVSLPLNWFACRAAEERGSEHAVGASATSREALAVMRRPSFWLLAIAFTTASLNHGMLLAHLLPLLAERGVAVTIAVLTASLIGPMQVLGRLLSLAAERRVNANGIAVGCFLSLAAAAIALFGAGAVPVLLVVFAFFQGSGYGVTSIVRPVITAELLGRKNFGVIAGLMAVPYMGAAAIGPTVSSFVWELGGYDLVIGLAGSVVLVGLASLLLATRLVTRSS